MSYIYPPNIPQTSGACPSCGYCPACGRSVGQIQVNPFNESIGTGTASGICTSGYVTTIGGTSECGILTATSS